MKDTRLIKSWKNLPLIEEKLHDSSIEKNISALGVKGMMKVKSNCESGCKKYVENFKAPGKKAVL